MADSTLRKSDLLGAGIAGKIRPGPEDTVLWIHGYTVDATIWEPIWSCLPVQRHIGIDLPGHGDSPILPTQTTLEGFGRQLAEVAVAHHVRHIVGLSLGSMIALQLVLALPNAFETLTLGAPALAGGPVASDVGVRFNELVELYNQRGAGRWMTELWMKTPPATFDYCTPELRRSLARIVDRHNWSELSRPPRGIVRLALERQDTPSFSNASARLMLMVGEHELPAFRKTAEILQWIRPDAHLVELAGVGHLCMLQAPETSAALMLRHWENGIGSDFSADGLA